MITQIVQQWVTPLEYSDGLAEMVFDLHDKNAALEGRVAALQRQLDALTTNSAPPEPESSGYELSEQQIAAIEALRAQVLGG